MHRMLTGSGVVLAAGIVCASALTLHAAPAAARFDGKPQFREGKALGYFVWREGETWKVRWTTFGGETHFSGAVIVEGGELRSFKRVDVDEVRRVVRPGRSTRVVRAPRGRVRTLPGRPPAVVSDDDHVNQENEHEIRFSVRTDDDIDGFDFTVGDRVDRIRFRLEIDGRTNADAIAIGARNVHPDEDPLVAILR